jgi:hypothetical protein
LLQVSHLPSAESSAEYSPPKTVAAMRCGNMAVAVWAVAVPSCDNNIIDHHLAVRSAGSPGSIMLWTHLDGLSACTMVRVTPEEHLDRRWWRKHHYAGHEGQ